MARERKPVVYIRAWREAELEGTQAVDKRIVRVSVNDFHIEQSQGPRVMLMPAESDAHWAAAQAGAFEKC